MRVLSFVVVALLVASAVAVSGDNKPEPKHRRAGGAVPARPLGSHLERVFPRVDTKLLRRSSRVVLVPKGDPRARPPTTPATPALASRRYSARTAHRGPVPSVPVTPAVAVPVAVGQKAPHIPRKPTQPTNPAHPTGTPGVNVGAAAPVAPTLKASAPAPVPSSSGSCLGGFNGATLATRALAYQSSYRNNGVVYSQPQRQFGASPPVHFADCSSFVTSVLDSLGWNCLFAAGRTTAAMLPIMEARGGFKQTAQKGDIVMWSGHTGIVVETCTGGSVRMVAMGTHGAADTGCITVEKLKGWGAGVFKGFWSPK